MGKEDKKEDRKEDEGLHDEEVGKAFDKWTSLGEKWGSDSCCAGPVSGKKEKEHFPEVSLKMPGKGEYKVGEEIEAKFKCEVTSVSKDKDGLRVRLELKEAKFD